MYQNNGNCKIQDLYTQLENHESLRGIWKKLENKIMHGHGSSLQCTINTLALRVKERKLSSTYNSYAKVLTP